MKKKYFYYLITLVSLSLFLILQLYEPRIIQENIEGRTFDLRIYLKSLIKYQLPSTNIIIIAIDEKSIREIGRWPWDRDIVAGLINNITRDKPKVIGIDIMFSEKHNKEADEKLISAIKHAGNVVLATEFNVPEKEDIKEVKEINEIPNVLWDSAFTIIKPVKGINWKQWSIKAESVNLPIDELPGDASLGHAYMHPDMDGVLRWDIMYLYYGGECYPSFPLQIARTALGIKMKYMVLYGGKGIMLGEKSILTDRSGRVVINYIGKEHSFNYKSASDVIKGNIPNDFFKDKIVLIGTSAAGTYDQKVTPLSANMPGVEKNANVVTNILQNNFIRKSHNIIELLVILFTGIFLGIILPRLKAIPGTIISIIFILFYVLLSCYLLIFGNLWINLIYPLSNMFVIFISQTVTKFFFEEKKAKEIRSMFSSYVSPKIVEELISNPEKAKLGGERKNVTILFADIIGFTTLSEKRSPEEVVEKLNEYFEEMTNIIFKWDGTLDKFVGDEIMAFWGAPLDQPNHAELAVRCALNMIDSLLKLQEKWIKEGKEILDCGIGINTGDVVIGNIGAAGKKMDYTVIGDHVNLAARVEKLTRQYNAKIIVTEFTLNHITTLIEKKLIGHYQLTGLDAVKVKGKENEVKIFELKGLKHEEDYPV
jgi:adenylate cyclase